MMTFTTLFIDLDETVYSPSFGIWESISARMEQYMHERLGLAREEIPGLRRTLYQQYGTTLHGLQVTRDIDTADFLGYVHDVSLEPLHPDPLLAETLNRYRQQKYIFTNADRSHALRVLDRLGIGGCFQGIIDINAVAPYCKPMEEAFAAAMRIAGETNPASCVFIDDSSRNLAGARRAGIYTIQVGSPKPGYQNFPAVADAFINQLSDLPLVIKP